MMVNIALMGVWWMYYTYENRRRDRLVLASGLDVKEQDYQRKLAGETDLTDREVGTSLRYAD